MLPMTGLSSGTQFFLGCLRRFFLHFQSIFEKFFGETGFEMISKVL